LLIIEEYVEKIIPVSGSRNAFQRVTVTRSHRITGITLLHFYSIKF